MNKFHTYIYYDPSRNNEPIYVGKGLYARVWKHLNRKDKHPFVQRMQFMKKNNIVPVIGLYAGLDEEFAHLLEEELIAKFGRKDLGLGPLLNLTDGGEGRYNPSTEARKKMSENNIGKALSVETKTKMSASRIGRVVSQETRKKISSANKGTIGHMTGKIQTLEAREKISLAQKGKPRGKRLYNNDGTWIMVKENN